MSIYKEKKQKTKYLIQKSFLQVLEKKKFELTTIGDITKIAQINRGTFYLHYSDKFDLLNQMEEQLFSDIGNHIDELQSRYLPTRTIDIEQKQLADSLFSSIEINAPIIKIFLGNHGRAGFHIRFMNAFSKKVRFNLEQHEGFYADLEVPLEYFLSFITSAFLGLIEQWIRNGLDKTPKEMTELYIEIILFIQRK
ncbi:TetR/AcrR family transcriptional regulator [Paenibacillus graminis]|uniref:Transcriptional regulator n=1 Tax=Paenibacillus graminis TaxID=189425 RepID=A0A089M4R5_9BACL|nr:TetR/AcrR family transcriptional regulator [Paenibacillus graminis]AIQ66468.1 transcriptional regulator [Paenibacillus graminis]